MLLLRRWKTRSGFTLIELLIVVAIIAILAAIAMPNFMEAQVRAKISRVRSDMRSIATAVESYIVDYHTVLGTKDLEELTNLDDGEARLAAYSKLTTPVAYLTSIPTDPFETDSQQERLQHVFQFQVSNDFGPNISKSKWRYPRKRGYKWGLGSYGPRLVRDGPVFRHVLRGQNNDDATKCFIYDSTNGTKSAGWIIRTNKGDMTSPDLSPGV